MKKDLERRKIRRGKEGGRRKRRRGYTPGRKKLDTYLFLSWYPFSFYLLLFILLFFLARVVSCNISSYLSGCSPSRQDKKLKLVSVYMRVYGRRDPFLPFAFSWRITSGTRRISTRNPPAFLFFFLFRLKIQLQAQYKQNFLSPVRNRN